MRTTVRAPCQLPAVVNTSQMYQRRVWSHKCCTVDCHQIYKSYQKGSSRYWAPSTLLQLHVSAVGTFTKLLRQRLWIHWGLRCLRVMLSIRSVIQGNRISTQTTVCPFKMARGSLNIRSHPEAWDSSPREAVNPIWAAALYFIERRYRVSWGGYSHTVSVSFGVRCSCAFCLQVWQTSTI